MLKTFEQAPLVKIRFAGELAERFGPEHEARGYSIPELMKGIEANHPDLRQFLFNTETEFRAFRGNAPIEEEEELLCPVAADYVLITPCPAGSGGVGRLLGGLALLGIGIATGGTSLAVAGLASALSGASQIFSKSQKTPKSDSERDSSFLFDSLGGAAKDGDPIPLAYGEGPVIGIPLSLSVSTSDI